MDGNMMIEELLEIADKPSSQEIWDDTDIMFVSWLEGRDFNKLSPAQKKKVQKLYLKLVE